MEDIIIITIFGLFGLCFGSFSTVLIDRWKKEKTGIIMGRSECPHCHHILGAMELLPLFSYIFQRGKCRNCSKKIPLFYPMTELLIMFLFMVLAWVALSFGKSPYDSMWYIFLFWGFVTGVYIVYDLRFMEIPDQIMIPGIYGTFFLLIYTSITGNYIQFDVGTYINNHEFVIDHIAGAWILYTFLFLQILLPGGWYLIQKKQWKNLLGLLLSYFLLPFMIVIELRRTPTFQNEGEEALPSWVGGGDLRIALFIGLTLGSIHGIASFLIAYVVGSIISIFLYLLHYIKHQKSPSSQVPFGPFLAIGWLLSLIFYQEILGYIIL